LKIDQLGWLDQNSLVVHKLSPNQSQRPNHQPVSLLVVHSISLPPGLFGGQYIEDFFLNRLDPDRHPYFPSIVDQHVSAHLLIKRDGSIVQFVSFLECAWHAGVSQYEGNDNCNDFSIGIEIEGTDHHPFEQIQYAQLAEVTKSLIILYPELTRDRIVGHSDIAPGRKTDPGHGFDWYYFRELL